MATFKDLEGFLKAIDSEVFSAKGTGEIGNKASDVIYKRVKSGYGVDDDQNQGSSSKQRLKELSPSYIAQRKRKGVTGEFGKPSKSNLTNTGQMLSSLSVKSKQGEFELVIPNSPRTDGKTNAEVARYASRSRPFFGITSAEKKILEKEVQDKIRAIARRFGFL